MNNMEYKERVKLLLQLIPVVSGMDDFAIHGGTAINLFVLDLPRYSVDIDLTFIPIKSREETYIIRNWNYPGNPIITQSDTEEGGITYTHAPSLSFPTHDINPHFDGQLTGNRRSFIDACWIKTYNGLGTELLHYYWLAPGRVTNLVVTPPKWNITNTATYGTSVNYYVRDVSERETP